VVAGTLAAAVAAAAVVVQGQAEHRTSNTGSRPGSSAAGTTGPAGRVTGPASRVAGPAASAAELVAFASRAAAAAPAFDPQPHQWIYTKFLNASSTAGETGALLGPPNERTTVRLWKRADGRKSAGIQDGKLVVSGLLGSPGGWPSASYSYLDSLPDDPAKLKTIIAANMKSDNYVVGSGQTGIFNEIENLMRSVVLPPRLSAGLYGVLATLTHVHFDPSVTDLAGRHGLGLYMVQEGYLKVEFVINPKTYAYMGDLYVTVKAHTSVGMDETVHYSKGQILGWSALLRSGIVQHAGQIPGQRPANP